MPGNAPAGTVEIAGAGPAGLAAAVTQGHYACDPAALARHPQADLSFDVIAGLRDVELPALLGAVRAADEGGIE